MPTPELQRVTVQNGIQPIETMNSNKLSSLVSAAMGGDSEALLKFMNSNFNIFVDNHGLNGRPAQANIVPINHEHTP